MSISDILLWSFAFILAFISIFVSWIGAVNSTKANEKLTDFLSSTWTETEAKKLFHDHLRNMQTATNELLRTIKASKKNPNQKLTYLKYAQLSRKTRLPFVSQRINTLLEVSIYSGILRTYIKHKTTFDDQFKKIIDISKLNSIESLTEKQIFLLDHYHLALISFSSIIMREYILTAKRQEEEEI